MPTAHGTSVQYLVGKLAGYGADVVEPEPIVPTSPLLTVPNVVLTPHVGSRTYESVERQAVTVVENTLRVLSGQPPHAPVPSVATGCSLPAFLDHLSRGCTPGRP